MRPCCRDTTKGSISKTLGDSANFTNLRVVNGLAYPCTNVIEISKASVVEHGAEPIAQEKVGVAARERGPGNAGGVVGHGWDRLLAKRHGRPPDKKAIQRNGPSQGCRFRQRCPIVYGRLF